MVAGEIECVSKEGGGIALAYFDDERDTLKRQLLEEVGEPVFDFIRGDQVAAWQWLNASAPGRFCRISDEPAEVFINDIKYDEVMPTRLLTDLVGHWIVDFFICVAEHKGTSFVQATQNTLGRIRRATMTMAVITGRDIRIAHGDKRMALPPSHRGALYLIRPGGAVLIVQTEDHDLTLELLAGVSGQLAAALGSRELANGLDAALLRLSSLLRDHPDAIPDDVMLAKALGVEMDSIKRTRRLASGDLISLLDFAIPLSACLGSPETTSCLQQFSASDDPVHEDLRAAMESLAAELGIPLSQLEERLAGLADLRDLTVEFGADWLT